MILNLHNNAGKDLDMFVKLIQFIRTIVIKNEVIANANETVDSMNNAARFINLINNKDTPDKESLLTYTANAIMRGYDIVVKDKANSYVKLTEEERISYMGNIYIFDKYTEVDKNTIRSTGLTTNLYVRRYNEANQYTYDIINSMDIDDYNKIYVKVLGGGKFIGVSKQDSFTYSNLYKLINNVNYIQYEFGISSNFFYVDTPLYNKYYIKQNSLFIEIHPEQIKVREGYYYIDGGVFIPATSLQDVLIRGIYDSSYSPVSKSGVELDGEYYGYKEYFNIIQEELGYYDPSSVYVHKNGVYSHITDIYVSELVSAYSNVFIPKDDGYLTMIRVGNEIINFKYNPLTKAIANISHNYSIKPKTEYCSTCYIGQLSRYVDLDGNTYHKCDSCGAIYTEEQMMDFKDIYMYTNGSTLLLEFTNYKKAYLTETKLIKKNKSNYKCYQLEYYRNNNSFVEKNEYYIELMTMGVDLNTARQLPNGAIIHYDNSVISEIEADRFISSYYVVKAYFDKMLDNEVYKIYKNYVNLVNFIVLIYSIVRFIDDDLKNSMNIDYFSRRDLLNMFYSFGIYEFDNIPEEYQIAILKNIRTLLKHSGTDLVVRDILNIFNNEYVQAFKYLLIKDYNKNEDNEIITKLYYSETELLSKTNTEMEDILRIRFNENREVENYYNNIDYVEYKDRIVEKITNEIDVDFSDNDAEQSVIDLKEKISSDFGITYDTYETAINNVISAKLISLYNANIDTKLSEFDNELKVRTELNRLYNTVSRTAFDYKYDLLTVLKNQYITKLVNPAVRNTITLDTFKSIINNNKTMISGINTEVSSGIVFNKYIADEFNVMYLIKKLVTIIEDYDVYSMEVMYDKFGYFFDRTKSILDIKQIFLDNIISGLAIKFQININYTDWINALNDTSLTNIYDLFKYIKGDING